MQTKIIAHRGASADAPENTLPAVQLAWEQNTDAVEIDILLSKDGHIVVFHDEDTLRMTGESGLIKDKTWDEIRQLTIESKGFKTHIPLLSDILPTIPQDKFLVIEIKCGPEIVPPLRKLIDAFSITAASVQFISLIEASLRELFKEFPEYETQRVFEFLGKKPDTDYLLYYAEQSPFTGIDLEMGNYIDKEFVEKIHLFKKKIYIWTVDDPTEAQKLSDLGIDGITTNHPGDLRTVLEINV